MEEAFSTTESNLEEDIVKKVVEVETHLFNDEFFDDNKNGKINNTNLLDEDKNKEDYNLQNIDETITNQLHDPVLMMRKNYKNNLKLEKEAKIIHFENLASHVRDLHNLKIKNMNDNVLIFLW